MEKIRKLVSAASFALYLPVFAAVPAYDTLISHRGESKDAPENTLHAFKTAVSRGFGFECDVYLSADKRVFTFHDGTLTRTTGGASNKKCRDTAWDELSRIDVGGWGKWKGSKFSPCRPALLEEVLDLAVDGRKIYVELKTGPEIVPYVKKIFESQKKANPGNALFICFNDKVCAELKKQMPEYKVYWLTGARRKSGDKYVDVDVEYVLSVLKRTRSDGVDMCFDPKVVTAGFIEKVKAAGFEFHVWTVDDLERAELAFDRGAQTVTTNNAKDLLDGYLAKEKGYAPFPEFSAPRAITRGPKDHFFASYYAINSWSPDNRYALVLETDIKEGLPDGRPCTLGVVDTEDGDRFIPFTTTRCWNFQEAAMAHWLPNEKDTVVFNDIRDGKFSAVVMNWKTGAERAFPYPVAAVSEDGTWAISINYARLFLTRPDYGYHGGGQDERKGTVFPEDDGLWKVDLKTGEAKLIVSCADVKDMVPAVKAPDGMSYLCHVVISKDMKRIYFLSRSVEKSMDGVKKFGGVNWHTTAFTCNADGTGIRRCFPDGWGSSHFNWKNDLSPKDAATMTVTCKFRNEVYTHVEFTVGDEDNVRQIGGAAMNFDGHCLYTPDGKFISGDGYFDQKEFKRGWKIVRLADHKVKDIGRFYVPGVYRTIYSRCDLHPRWRPDGEMIGFNSVHEGSRQVYVMDVVKNVPVKRPALVPMPRKVEWKSGVCPAGAKINESRDRSIPPEGYRLEVAEDAVNIVAGDDAGAFYARQTLRQLEFTRYGKKVYHRCRIEDRPEYSWRGMLIDEGRHFLGKETAKRVIELISMHKYNRLHWHLTEDQGWRIDVPGLPELAKYGSVRAESPKHGSVLRVLGGFRYRSTEMNGQQYGPFYYTRKDLEEVVAYAKERHVEIVPEIELPGHAVSALAAYPELSCFPESVKPRMAASDWGIHTNVLCVGNDKTLRFLEKVMDYVCEVFPFEVIHVGGDECPRVNWERCPKCQARMKAEGLESEGELQAWITRKMAEYVAKKGRRIMGWDEILSGNAPKTAIGQSWRTQAGEGAGTEHVSAAAGAKRGFDMVISPHNMCYYTYFSGLAEDPFQYSTKTALTLERAYTFDPMKGIDPSLRKRILGAEACCWGEYTWNEYDLMWKMWPRACAMAEILWTNPQPRDFSDFRERVKDHRRRLVSMYVNCQPVE